MIRVKGRYFDQSVKLEQPLDLPDNTEVEVEVRAAGDSVHEAWTEIGMDRLEEAWDNPGDSVYDDWKNLYGV